MTVPAQRNTLRATPATATRWYDSWCTELLGLHQGPHPVLRLTVVADAGEPRVVTERRHRPSDDAVREGGLAQAASLGVEQVPGGWTGAHIILRRRRRDETEVSVHGWVRVRVVREADDAETEALGWAIGPHVRALFDGVCQEAEPQAYVSVAHRDKVDRVAGKVASVPGLTLLLLLVLPGRYLGGHSDSSADATGGKLTGGSSSSSMVWASARVLAVRPEAGAVRVGRGR